MDSEKAPLLERMNPMKMVHGQEDEEEDMDTFDGHIGGVNLTAELGGGEGPSGQSDYDEALAAFMRSEIDYDQFMARAGGMSLDEEEQTAAHDESSMVMPKSMLETSEVSAEEEYEIDDSMMDSMDESVMADEDADMPSTSASTATKPKKSRLRRDADTGLPSELQRIMREVMNENDLHPPQAPSVNIEEDDGMLDGPGTSGAVRPATYRHKKLNKTLDALLGQANLIYARGQTGEALTMLLEVIRQEPRNADSYRQVADIYLELGDEEKSLQYGLLAAYLEYHTPSLEWMRLGAMAEKQNSYEMAAAAYGRALRLDPTNWACYEKRIAMLDHVGFRQLAMRTRLQAAQNTDYVRAGLDFEWFLNLIKIVAEYFIEVNDEDKAMTALETFVLRAVQFGKSSASQHETLLTMWISKGRFKEALKSILCLRRDQICVVNERGDEIVKVQVESSSYDITPFPLPAESRFLVADELPMQMLCKALVCLVSIPGQKQPAQQLTEALLSRPLSDPSAAPHVVDVVKAIYNAEWYTMGRKLCESLHVWGPMAEDANLRFAYGNMLTALHENELAMEAFERVLQINPQHVDARINLSGLQQRAGMSDKALETLRDYDLEGCSLLPDERLLMRQAEFLFERGQTEQFIRCARMLLTPYFYEIHRNPDVIAKKRMGRNSTVWALSTTLRQSALHALQGTPLEKFVKRLGAVAYSEQNRMGDEMDATCLHDYCLKLIESLLGMKRYSDMLTVCCYAFLQPKITRNEKSLTFQSLLYFSAIKAQNWGLAFEYTRWFHQSTMSHHPSLMEENKEVMCKRIFNAMNYVFCHSQNVSYHRYVMRTLSKNPGNHALQTISGNNSLITGSYRHALGEFLRVWMENKSNPLICLLIGLTFTHMACKKDLSSRHMLCIRGLAFLRRYELTRSVKQEVYYNLGRAFHQLSITTLAIYFYEKALKEAPPQVVNEDGEPEPAERYDMTRFAAHNLALMYHTSGNIPLAYEVMEKYLVI